QAATLPVGTTESTDQARPATAPVSPAAMVSSDLWSGFATTSGLRAGPSLIEAPTAAHHSAATTGVAVFSFALVALFAGFGLAETRRRRVSASTT
ncbi:MAG TPA: hypothetical protein VM142_00250, partial [Acidimicrobiales bacterium]|nr:hypothetical protein [Acidimicrobiales bacterium]